MANGFEIRDAAGNLTLRMTEALPTLIYSQRVAHDYTGTISVPAFDSARGLFYVSPCLIKAKASNVYTRLPDSLSLLDPSSAIGLYESPLLVLIYDAMPTISWDNSTKLATITPASLPSNWPGTTRWTGSYNPDYYLNFVHVHAVDTP